MQHKHRVQQKKMVTHLLSLASISSTASHATRASLDVGPNFLLAAMASWMASVVSTRALRNPTTPGGVSLLGLLLIKAEAPVEQARAAKRELESFIVGQSVMEMDAGIRRA